MIKIILSLFFVGLSFGIGPCLASCGPLLITYVAGTGKNIIKSIGVYFLFSLSRIFVYLVLSLIIFLSGQVVTKYLLGPFSKYFFILGGLFIIAIGLLVIAGKNLDYKFCKKAQDLFLKKDNKTIITFGLITGLLPCAPFISTVSFIGLISKHWLNSLLYTLAFGIGTVISPLFLLVLFTGLIPKIMINKLHPCAQERGKSGFYRVFNLICGLIIVFLGLQLLGRAFSA